MPTANDNNNNNNTNTTTPAPFSVLRLGYHLPTLVSDNDRTVALLCELARATVENGRKREFDRGYRERFGDGGRGERGEEEGGRRKGKKLGRKGMEDDGM